MIIRISGISVSSGVAKGLSHQVSYLEKENNGKPLDQQEYFFNQDKGDILSKDVLEDLGSIKMSKIPKGRPHYYNLIISPSQKELAHIKNNTTEFKKFVREVMKRYAEAFHRELNGRPIKIDDIKYHAKVEHQRYYSGRELKVRENAPYLKRIKEIKQEIRVMEQSQLSATTAPLKEELAYLKANVPHRQGNEIIRRGLQKDGLQMHAHVLISRRDASNSVGLSPDGPTFASTVNFNGKTIKTGFLREQLVHKVEESFDKMFNYPRNYVETYAARKTLKQNPQEYYQQLAALPRSEKKQAFELLKAASLHSSPTLSLQAIKQIGKALGTYSRSAEIEY